MQFYLKIYTLQGYRSMDGKFLAPTVQVGDTVILPDFVKDEVNFEGQDYVIGMKTLIL